jgi:hypothetical protein
MPNPFVHYAQGWFAGFKVLYIFYTFALFEKIKFNFFW